MRFLEMFHVKLWGAVILTCLVSFAAGNAFATRAALDGQADWFRHDEHVKIMRHVDLQKKLDDQ